MIMMLFREKYIFLTSGRSSNLFPNLTNFNDSLAFQVKVISLRLFYFGAKSILKHEYKIHFL